MDFYLSEGDRKIIQATQREVLLALVFASGEMKIKVADANLYPGHVEWIERDQIDLGNVNCGFSFIVKDGQVTGLFSSSELNRTPDWRLDASQLASALRLLPLSSEFRSY